MKKITLICASLFVGVSLSNAQTYNIATVAGGGVGDGYAATSAVTNSQGVARDAAGNIYIADKNNSRIRKITTGGIITTIAGNGTFGYSGDNGQATAATLNSPEGVAVDATGNIFIADTYNYRVREINTSGVITTIAGNGVNGNTGNGGPATAAEVEYPSGIAVGTGGTVYLVDQNNRIVRMFPIGGNITVIAGTGTQGFSGDGGPATGAMFNSPSAIAIDGSNNIYIADMGNSRIRKITGSTITTIAGIGTASFSGDGGLATAAGINWPDGVVVDASNNIYISDQYNQRIRKITPGGTISTIAGNGTGGFTGDGGPATAAELSYPSGVACDGSGNAYIADNGRVRLISSTGTITTYAGGGVGDGEPATSAFLNITPTSSSEGISQIVVDGSGDIFIGDFGDNRVREVNTSGNISTIAGNGKLGYLGDNGPATAAELYSPGGLIEDGSGNFYISDIFNNRIREVNTSGTISTFAGNGTAGYSGDGAAATNAELNAPAGAAIDASGNIYVADPYNNRVRKITPGGIITTVAGNGTAGFSGDNGAATAAELNDPLGVAIDGSGNLYIADYKNNCVRKVTAAGIISTFAGAGGVSGFSGDGAAATAAHLNGPTGVAVNNSQVYIADYNNNRVRRVNANGIISTIAGTGGTGFSGDGGPAGSAQVYGPMAVYIDGSGNIFVTDNGNNRIRKLTNSCNLSASVSGTNPTCYGANNGSAVATPVNGTSPYAYAWSPVGGNAATGANLMAGNYTCTVTDINGCTATATVALTQPAAPLTATVTASPSSICAGGTSNISASVSGGTSPYSYMWNNGLTATSITVGSSNSIVTTLAGSTTSGSADGTGSTAGFKNPYGIVADRMGNLYVADGGNNKIRKIVVSTGAVTTLAGSGTAGSADGTGTGASFSQPDDVVLDGNGNMYVTDANNNKIRKIVISTGVVTTLAGGSQGSANGIGTAASFFSPMGIAMDTNGNLYVADMSNNEIRKIVPSTGVVTTVAGSTTAGSANGTGAGASFNWPFGLVADHAGNLYVGDESNNEIRKIVIATGVVTTLAGSTTAGTTDGIGTAASFNASAGLALDGNGNLYVADVGNNEIRKVIISTGAVTTLAGTTTAGSSDGIDSAAGFNQPWNVATDPGGNLFISDGNNNEIRKLIPKNVYSAVVHDQMGCGVSAGTQLIVNQYPVLTHSANPTTICQGSGSSLTASGAGTYAWAPSTGLVVTTGANVSADPASTTIYTITATGAGGCTKTDTVKVNVNASPTVNITASTYTLCAGNGITLSANGANTYTWSPAAGLTATTGASVTASPTVTTTYTLTGTNANGCTGTATAVLTINALPTISTTATPSVICLGNTSSITASGGSTYTWSPNSTLNVSTGATVTATPTATITYTITGTNAAGCSSNATQVITVNANPNVTATAAPQTICAGSTSTLTASGANTYTWSPSSTLNVSTGSSVTASPTSSFTYTVTGTNAAGCTGTGTTAVFVNASPTVTASASTYTLCVGGNTTLTASASGGTPPYNYSWSPAAGLSVTTGASVTATPTTSTTYTVTGANSSGCTSITTVVIAVNPTPTITVTATPSVICIGSNSSVVASGASTYTWSPITGLSATTGASVTASPASSITYTITGTSTGCSGAATQVITVNPTPTVTGSASPQNICAGSNSNLTAAGANTYAWSPSASLNVSTGTSVTAMPAVSTTYTVTGTDGNGCIAAATIPITVNALPTITATANKAKICSGNTSSLTATNGVSYTWAPSASLSASTGSSVTATPSVTTVYTVTGTDGNSCVNTAPVLVTIDAALAVNMTTVNESCNGLVNGNATANVTGGTAPFTYLWNTGATTNLIYNLAVNTYSVTVTDSVGCSKPASGTVTQPSAVSVNASSTNTSCGAINGTATANPSGGVVPYNYSWSTVPAQTGASISGLTAGTYTVTLTDGTGCTASATATVGTSGGPVINPTVTNSTCGVKDGRIKVTITGGTAPYRYSWNNGDTLAVDSNLAASTYIITVTDKFGCSTFQAININDAGAPTINVSSVTNVKCNGDTSGAITLNVTGGSGGYKYSWSNSATVANISNLSAGPYQVVVIDAGGCSAVSTINITEPAVLVTSTNIVPASCGNSDGSTSVTVTGGVSPYTYLWNTGATNTGLANIAAGTYSVVVTDANGCSLTDLASVANASGPLVTLDSVINMDCISKTMGKILITVSSGTPPYSYLWNNSATTGNINGLGAGNYAVTVTDAAGCKGANSASITTALPPGVSICMVTVDPKTNYNTLVWDASNNSRIAKYYIYKETTKPGIFNKIGYSLGTSGKYLDTLSNADSRAWDYEISELDSCGQASPISQSILFKTIHLTATLTTSNAVDLVWDNFEGASFSYYIIYRDSIAGVASDSIASVSMNTFGYVDYPATNKNWYYHVGIGGSLSCTIPPTIGHTIESINYNASKSNTGNITFVGPLATATISSANTLNIYPNPNRGVFNMQLNLCSQQNVKVKICDALGQVLEQYDYSKQSGKLLKQYDFSSYSKGVYTIQVITDDGVTYRKVVIQ